MRTTVEKKKRAAKAKPDPKKKPVKETKLLDFFERVFLPEYLNGKKPSYRQAYCRAMTRFMAFTRGDVEVTTLSAELFAAYKDWHLECNRGAPSTAYGDLVRVRRVAVAAGRCELRARTASIDKRTPEAPPSTPIDMQKFYRQFYRVQRSVSRAYDQQIVIALESLRRFNKGPVMFDELAQIVSPWIAWLEDRVAPRTVKSKRASVISLWYAAAELGMCRPPDTRMIRKPKVQRPSPDAWTMDEMKSLLEASRTFRNDHYANGINRGAWWEAFIRVCYDTALRRGDMMSLRRDQLERIKGGYVLRTVQSKTGDGIVHRLHDKTVEAVKAIISPERDLIFDWPHSLWTVHNHWQDLVDRAGMDATHRRNGVQKLRRTSASHLEQTKPGSATAHLGHRCSDMARMHYLDPKISRGELPMPPEID